MDGNEKTDITQTAFMLILHAGNARNHASEAEHFASEYHFEKAKEYIQKAKDDLNLAHQIQTDLIQSEARGEMLEFRLIMVHAQDHLMMAMSSIDRADRITDIYEKMYQLTKERESE